MKLKIHFASETRFCVPNQKPVRKRIQLWPSLEWLAIRKLAMAEPAKPCRRGG